MLRAARKRTVIAGPLQLLHGQFVGFDSSMTFCIATFIFYTFPRIALGSCAYCTSPYTTI